MILYNFKYRGPYEYEKFVLNIFQFLNEMTDLQAELSSDMEMNLTDIKELLEEKLEALENLSFEYALRQEAVRQI